MNNISILSKWCQWLNGTPSPVPLYLVGGAVRDLLLGQPAKDRDEVLSIQDLEVGSKIEHEWEWRTSKFRRLHAKDVASFWNQSFRELHIPTQGEVALEVGSGAHVVPEWVKRVKEVYK